MIKRTIYLNNINDLDLDNLGVHFTADLGYKHRGGGSTGVTNTETAFRVDVFVSQYVVNEEATAMSNEGYPTEHEVVLEMNQEIDVEVVVVPRVNIGWGSRFHPEYKKYNTKANTGNRADEWVKNLSN